MLPKHIEEALRLWGAQKMLEDPTITNIEVAGWWPNHFTENMVGSIIDINIHRGKSNMGTNIVFPGRYIYGEDF